MTATAANTAGLPQRAREAYATAQVTTRYQEMRRRTEQVENIYRALAKLDITPADDTPAFVNSASGQICVPLIAGELRIEAGEGDAEGIDFPTQTHAVAAEWDSDDHSVYLVADLDYDDDYDYSRNGRRLYPAGHLHTLADLGEAIENGGRKPSAPATAKTEARQILYSLNGDHLDHHDAALLAAAEAVCTVLADIADAIRAGHRP